MGLTIIDREAATIAKESYKYNLIEVQVTMKGGKTSYWKVIDEIRDKETGLHMYVIQNPKTKEVVISFEGTRPPDKFSAVEQTVKDIEEDINGIVAGTPNHVKKEYRSGKYRGSPSQDALLASDRAYVKDGDFYIKNKNQFTASEDIVNKYIKKYGADNVTFVGHSLGGALALYYAVKHNAHAITFAAADAYKLLTDAEKKKVREGAYRDKIISYTYPLDFAGTMHSQSIGSVYYVGDPLTDGAWFFKHGIANFTNAKLYDEDGYLRADVLYDELTYGRVPQSPLALKYSGQGNVAIFLQTEIMRAYGEELRATQELLSNSLKQFREFPSRNDDAVNAVKSKYYRLVGTGAYDKMTAADVDEAFKRIAQSFDKTVPLFYDASLFDYTFQLLGETVNGTAEIAYHIEQIAEKFAEIDQRLAQTIKQK